MESNLLLITLLVLGLGVVAAIILFLRRIGGAGISAYTAPPYYPADHKNTPRPRNDNPHWILGVGLAVALIALFAWRDDRDTRWLAAVQADRAALEAGYLPNDRARFTVDLNTCPPRTDGMTDQVVMVIATQRDGGHVVHGCSRIAERQYMRRGVKG